MDHGSWIMDHGSWIIDHGSWIQIPHSLKPALRSGVEYTLEWNLSVFRKITMIMTSNIKLSCRKGRVLAHAQLTDLSHNLRIIELIS